MKRFLSLLTAVFIVFNLVSVNVYADPSTEITLTATADRTGGSVGESVTVEVAIGAHEDLGGCTLQLLYDGSLLELTGTDLSGDVLSGSLNGETLVYSSANANGFTGSGGKLFAATFRATAAGEAEFSIEVQTLCDNTPEPNNITPQPAGDSVTIALSPGSNNTPALREGVEAAATAQVAPGVAYTLDLFAIFEDADGDELTYAVAVDGADAVAADEQYSYTPQTAGVTGLVFTASDGTDDSATYTVALTATSGSSTVTVTVGVYDYAALDAGVSGASPNGVILSDYEVTVPADATAYDAFVAAFAAHEPAIAYTAQNYGDYFMSINGLSEMADDDYPQSGWVFSINDDFGNLGTAYQTMANGDLLQMHYSMVGYGSDVGCYWSPYIPTLTSFSLGGVTKTLSYEVTAYADYKTTFEDTVAYKIDGAPLPGSGTEADPFQIGIELAANTDVTALVAGVSTTLNAQHYRTLTPDVTEETDYTGPVTFALCTRGNAYETYYCVTVSRSGSGGPVLDELEFWRGQARAALYGDGGADGSIAYLQNLARTSGLTVATTGGDWTALCLARALESGSMPDDIRTAYLGEVERVVTQAQGVLHVRKYTEYSRVILAWTALGWEADDVAGYDFIARLSDFYWVNWQGINGTIYALIAADTKGYDFADADTLTGMGYELRDGASTRQRLIENILGLEITDAGGVAGGWALTGSVPDAEVTAMAIQALAPYRAANSAVDAAVERALEVLRRRQADNGDFASWGTINMESCAQVVVALCALGLDPLDADNGFVKDGGNLIEALLRYRTDDDTGAFRHTPDGGSNAMATDQATCALIAYERLLAGESRLFDMTDVEPDPGEPLEEGLYLNGILLESGAIDTSLLIGGINTLLMVSSDGGTQRYTLNYTAPKASTLRFVAVNNTAYLTCDACVLAEDTLVKHDRLKETGTAVEKFKKALSDFEEIDGYVASVNRLTALTQGKEQKPYGSVTVGIALPENYGGLTPMLATLDGGLLEFLDTTVSIGFAAATVNTLDENIAVIMLTADSVAEVGKAVDATDYDALIKKIENADEGDAITLKVTSKSEVPWKVFEALRDAETDVSLRFYSSRYGSYWTFVSDDIPDTLPATDCFDPWVVLSETDAAAKKRFGDQAFLSVAFRTKDKLPGRSTLLFPRSDALQGAEAVTLWSLLADSTALDATERFAFEEGWNAVTVTFPAHYVLTAADAAAPGTQIDTGGGSADGQPEPMQTQPFKLQDLSPQETPQTADAPPVSGEAQEALERFYAQREDLETFLMQATENQQSLKKALVTLQSSYQADIQKAVGETAALCAGALCLAFAATILLLRLKSKRGNRNEG